MTTWLKHDGVGSDMFFLFTRKVFHTWWVREVRRKLTQGVFRECCPEECFKGVKVSQDRQLKGCLARDHRRISCWWGALIDDTEMKVAFREWRRKYPPAVALDRGHGSSRGRGGECVAL